MAEGRDRKVAPTCGSGLFTSREVEGPPAAAGGFSLLEVMVAVSILAIALMGIMSLYINTITLSEVNREAQFATFAAQQKLEEIRGMAFANIPTVYPAGTPVYFAVTGLRAFGANPQPGWVTVDYTNPSLISVTVQVRWDGVRGEGNVRFSTMISPS